MLETDEEYKHWLYNSIKFDSYLSSSDVGIKDLTDYIFGKLSQDIPITSRKRQRDALKHIIVNGIVSYRINRPVAYSRRMCDYTSGKFYSKDWFRYDRIVPVIDWLVNNEYLQHHKGSYDKIKRKGYSSKFWAGAKLLKLFIEFRIDKHLEKTPKEQLIILKDKVPREPNGRKTPLSRRPKAEYLSYRTTADIRNMRDFLNYYNDFIKGYELTLELTGEEEVPVHYLIQIFYGELTGQSELTEVNYYTDTYSTLTNSNHTTPIDHSTYLYTTLLLPLPILLPTIPPHPSLPSTATPFPTDTGRFRCEPAPTARLQRLGEEAKTYFLETMYEVSTHINRLDKEERSRKLKEVIPLKCLGISKLHLRLKYKWLHRVFREASFKKHGRFYGAGHINVPSTLRQFIKINGQSTTEPDYSGLHIRMLYHRLGKDYRDECYVYEKSDVEHKAERLKFKLVALVSINAEDYEAPQAVLEKFKDEDVWLKKGESPLHLIDVFKSFHKPIEEFLFSGVGNDLMFKDSTIMEAILKSLLKKNIPALPVHDSIIVQQQHQEVAKQVMVEGYEKVMGFKPVIS